MSTKSTGRPKANIVPEGDEPNPTRAGKSNEALLETSRNPKAALKHFGAIDQIKKDWLQNSLYVCPAWANFDGPRPSGADAFFSQTLSTPVTVPHMTFLVKRDLRIPSIMDSLDQEITDTAQLEYPADLVVLVQLQSPGLDGWPGIAHGGFNCALLDCAMGHAVTAHRMKLDETDNAVGGVLFTAGLNVRCLAPVKSAAQVVLVKSSLLQRTRTKWLAKAQVTTIGGRVLVESTSVWIISPGLKL